MPGKPEEDDDAAALDRRVLSLLQDGGARGLLRTDAIPDPVGAAVTTRLIVAALAGYRVPMPLKARS